MIAFIRTRVQFLCTDGGVSERFHWRFGILCSGLGLRILSAGYVVLGQSITVKRLIGSIKIPLQGVREARIATPDDLSFLTVLFSPDDVDGFLSAIRMKIPDLQYPANLAIGGG